MDNGRVTHHTRVVYDMDWKRQAWNQYHYDYYDGEIDIPPNFSTMIDIVTKLAQGFSHIRVDLYNVSGKIYFGEMTFTNGAGIEEINPIEADYMLGKLWELDMSR